jgi:hypothetical protein
VLGKGRAGALNVGETGGKSIGGGVGVGIDVGVGVCDKQKLARHKRHSATPKAARAALIRFRVLARINIYRH